MKEIIFSVRRAKGEARETEGESGKVAPPWMRRSAAEDAEVKENGG